MALFKKRTKEEKKKKKKERKEKLKKWKQRFSGKNIAAFAVLNPFRWQMLAILKAKKIDVKPTAPISEIADKFYWDVLKKGQSFDSIEPVTISLMVSAIIGFIKGIAKKKKEGEAMSEEEKAFDLASENTDKTKSIVKQMGKEAGEGFMEGIDLKKILGGIALLILLFFIAKQATKS